MQIYKNKQEIEINNRITHLQINEYDEIKINAYSDFFHSKLDNGSLVLDCNDTQIRIHNITNVLNSSNAYVEFLDYKIDSMDELFNLIKDSLNENFYIDLEGIMSDLDEPSVNLEKISKKISKKKSAKLIDNNKNQKLLILITTIDINSIYNFALFYAKNSITAGTWSEIEIVFYGEAIEYALNDIRVKERLMELSKHSVGIKFNEFSYEIIQDSRILKEIGIKTISNDYLLTNALNSEDWRVISI